MQTRLRCIPSSTPKPSPYPQTLAFLTASILIVSNAARNLIVTVSCTRVPDAGQAWTLLGKPERDSQLLNSSTLEVLPCKDCMVYSFSLAFFLYLAHLGSCTA